MEKRVIYWTVYLVFFTACSYAQEIKDDSVSCRKVLNEVSIFWKNDSLANNGYRLTNYRKLISARLDNIYRGLLLSKLGNPNEIKKTNHGEDYVYFFYDSDKMPRNTDDKFELGYISFHFGIYDKYAVAVTEGVKDY